MFFSHMGVNPKIGENPPNHPFVHRVFHYKPSILGGKHPYFWFNTHMDGVKFQATEAAVLQSCEVSECYREVSDAIGMSMIKVKFPPKGSTIVKVET